VKYTDISIPVVVLSCHVGKPMIWRTTAKEETSTLQHT